MARSPVDDFLAELSTQRRMSPHTAKAYARDLRRLLDLAGGLGAGEAWLLTTTAADFFAALGFSRVPRDAAPPAVRATEQFARLCPESAVLMRLRLAMLAPPRITR